MYNTKIDKYITHNDMCFYVYIYLDPRKPGKYVYGDLIFDYEPFYVGKDKNNRIIEGINDTRGNSFKLFKINKIKAEQLEIIYFKLFDNLTEPEAFDSEIITISKIGRKIDNGPLCNIHIGGSGGDNFTYHPDKQKIIQKLKLLSEINKEKNKGENNPFYGKKHSEETKKIISEINKTHTGENNHFYGKNHTEESKEKIRQKAIGRKRSDEAKKKTSETLKNKNWSGMNNPSATKYIIQTPDGSILEFFGRNELKEKLKGINYRKIIEEGENKGYKLIEKEKIYKIS